MAAIVDSEAWRDFFAAYRNLPELWNVNCPDYKSRDKKRKSWPLLLEKYKAIDKDASLDGLKSKLNNIRYCYRRELRKVQKSERAGASFDAVHVPTLWYFSLLDFVKSQEVAFIAAESDDDDSTSFSIPPSKKKCPNFKEQILLQEIDPLDFPRNQPSPMSPSPIIPSSNTRDDAAVYAEGWAYTYRKLSLEQQLKAKKAIDEILLLGILGKLTFNSVDFTAALSPFEHSPSAVAQPQQVARPSSSAYTTSSNCNINQPKLEIYDNGELLWVTTPVTWVKI